MTQPARDPLPRRRGGAPYRCERALTAGLLCGPGGATAHVLAGGTPPTVLALVLLTVAACAGAWLVAARRLGLPALLLLAGAAQAVLHHAFGSAPTTAGGHGMSHPGGDGQTTMLLAHAAVAVLVALVARSAEASWWSLVRAALLRLLPVLPVLGAALPVTGPRPRPVPVDTASPTSRDAPEVVGPRGPPAGAAASAQPRALTPA